VREAVFSSTGFRIRAAQGQAADHDFAKQGLANNLLAHHGFTGFVERAAATLFFTIFPSDCRICGSPLIKVSRLPVCDPCLLALRPLKGSYCIVCGQVLHLPASFNHHDVDADDPRCLLCQRVDPPFERAAAYGSYEGGLRDLIHLLKFQQVRPAAKVLGKVLAETIAGMERAMPVGTIVVVPVPLHKKKQAQRGFNQAEMIARAASEYLARPKRFDLATGVLVRRRETGSQIGLTSHQRRENLRGAFTVSDPTHVLHRDILLIDDVITTGTTASECARVLLRAGAARVWVATVARTLKLSDVLMPALPEALSEQQSEERGAVAAHG
jgi:ComF family protein